MRWSSGVSTGTSLADAAARCVAEAVEGLGGEAADLVLVFASAHFRAEYGRVADLVRAGLPEPDRAVLIGCSAGGVIGAGREFENGPALAVAAASLPGVRLTRFHAEDARLPDADAGPDGWMDLIGVEPAQDPQFVLLADPMTIRGESLLMGLDFAYPAAVKVGGLASGAGHGGHALFTDEGTRAGGAGGRGDVGGRGDRRNRRAGLQAHRGSHAGDRGQPRRPAGTGRAAGAAGARRDPQLAARARPRAGAPLALSGPGNGPDDGFPDPGWTS